MTLNAESEWVSDDNGNVFRVPRNADYADTSGATGPERVSAIGGGGASHPAPASNADHVGCPNLASGECREPCHPDYCEEQSQNDPRTLLQVVVARIIRENKRVLDALAAYDTCTCGNTAPDPASHGEHCPWREWASHNGTEAL